MKAVVFNTFGSMQCDAFTLSLLCDNVQYHLEAGYRSERFLCIHTLADAPWQRRLVSVNAGRLQVELQHSWSQLGEVDIEALAISNRTQAILEDPSAAVGVPRMPTLLGASGKNVRVPPTARLLSDVFGSLVSDLQQIACEAPARSRIMMRCTAIAPNHRQP
jgi:hypothetical protein